MLASWVGALGTVLAAIVTFGTLLFLHYQHKQNVQKQNLMWSKQEAALDFARYRDHRQQFEQLLDGLEKDYGEFYVFRDRATLYKSLFPMNTPRNDYSLYKYKLDVNDLKGHPLESAYHWLKEHLNSIDSVQTASNQNAPSPSVSSPLRLFDQNVEQLAASINLQCTRHSKAGDIMISNVVFANIFKPTLMMDCLEPILYAINEFCGLEQPTLSGGFHSKKELGFKVYAEFCRPDAADFYSANKGANDIIEVLYQSHKLCELLDNQSTLDDFLFGEVYSETNTNQLLKKLDDNEAVSEFMYDLQDQLHVLNPIDQPNNIRVQIGEVRQAIPKRLRS
ncbi:hypothetical protein SAMN04488136_13019 [Vibrio xiamenensis]|uniref:Uncharacterized protein n=2 Tax=Vibrio xiamenensis TaxID=861298 RepID=A0A1G8FEE9_9VIBR|nr:hypothetical protein SAMN04488136_13019 [Vibrio xiamenensis]